MRYPIPLLIAICAAALAGSAPAQTVRPGSSVQINAVGPSEPTPAQPDKAFQTAAERERAMGPNPPNGCPCDSNNRCHHSLDLNFCIDKSGNRVYIQRYWGQ